MGDKPFFELFFRLSLQPQLPTQGWKHFIAANFLETVSFTTPTPYPGMETIVIAETERKPTLSKPLTLLARWRSE